MKSDHPLIKSVFKKCTNCEHIWDTRNSFLADPGIKIIGYQADFRELTEGLFLFNHTCGTTVSIKAQFFIDLNDRPIFQDRLTDGEECLGYCHIRNNLLPCHSKCECAYVREVLQVVKSWPKAKV